MQQAGQAQLVPATCLVHMWARGGGGYLDEVVVDVPGHWALQLAVDVMPGLSGTYI